MVAHDNTVMNATITNATPSADDESTLSESTPIETDPQRDVMSDVVPDVTPEEVPGTTIASTPATATVPAEEMKPSQSVAYRPMRWNDLDDIVREFDRTWGQCSAAAGTPVSMQISRHFVLHYLEPTTRAIIAELDGRFMGVTLSRVAGEPLAFPQAKQELAAINGELNRSTLGAKTLSETEQWHEMELRMEREIDINDVARGEIELFLVDEKRSRTRRRRFALAAGDGLFRELPGRPVLPAHRLQLRREDFYDHKGLNCIAARYAADHPEDGADMDDIFIYAGTPESAR